MTEHRDIAERLERERPMPRPAFVGRLRRQLLGAPDSWREFPARLRRLVAAYLSGGLLLLAVAMLGVAGAGPFAA
jgi:hypothetical protein